MFSINSNYAVKDYGNMSEVVIDKKVICIGSYHRCLDYVDDNMAVTDIDGLPITRTMLEEVFNMVANKDNWKNPIDITLPSTISLDSFERRLISSAIEFYHGCLVEVFHIDTNWHIRSEGYSC